MHYADKSLEMHAKWRGKIEMLAVPPLEQASDLSLAYTPGVAAPCLEIQKDTRKSYKYTLRHNLCAVITDGSAVLGLGNIGPEAAMPVMEGKCALFKRFGNVDAFPLCINTQNTDEFVETVYNISCSFGGINLEDISAPRCFEIEQRLKEKCDIPVFHDDQHGTAVVILAGVINALKVLNRHPGNVKIVISGAGAAGTAVAGLLKDYGFENIIVCDRNGIIHKKRNNLNSFKSELANLTNPDNLTGSLADAFAGSDIFIGTSVPGIVSPDMIKKMNPNPAIFACANPVPEILPEMALACGAKIVATGCSNYPNQLNNLLAFPGIFRGAFDSSANNINEEMKLSAALALASLVSEDELSQLRIIPSVFNEKVVPTVAAAVSNAAIESHAIRKQGGNHEKQTRI